ncbi:Protein kinase C-like phorbol ester/diacylglycerol-binding domain [Arabidopsis suecica]|uniref:Protein kinase C-like phorbol ester/diacylglycerol-binding domain n=1 Tax=Arabidopsis suecica TaxID=45249 RepID=A0A8T1YMZ6_ARASU|nr:Protein kinase C-like phorbol ester/diacylglycerol-binding domain [Arabidopsis suecica]
MKTIDDIYTLFQTRGLKCDGCNLGKDYYSDGYRCFRSGLFFHKECAESNPKICNLYHPQHSLDIKILAENEEAFGDCKLCRGNLPKMYYYCLICDFSIDLICAKKKVMETIENPKTHEHPLQLVPKMSMFTCHLCGLHDDRFPYACKLCNLSFHKDCAESTPEIEYSCHPKHILKRLTRVPRYTDGKCCLCRNKLHYIFYHCSICNFSVDVNCAKNPLPSTIVNIKAHEHLLTLMPQRNFVCDVCGMDDDPNPYVCLPCNFMIHRNCIDKPSVIKIYRHDHRIYYNHCLDAGDWKCGVCNKEIKWTCGAYSCSKCPDFAIHPRCVTRLGIWDGIELEGIPENNLEIKSYEVIEDGEIRHFSHEEHNLKLKEESDANNKCMWCKACNYPIYSNSFYSCMECDDFILHKECAYLPKNKIDPFYNMLTTLITNDNRIGICNACENVSQGFSYVSDDRKIILDVRCGSISEPFVHESHPLHSLYISRSTEDKFCIACGDKATMALSCEECEFILDIKCSTLPKMVKHKNDKDHFLSLCYGEKTSDQYWCEICEEELNARKWFYSCDDCGITFHIKCTLGDFRWMYPKGKDESLQTYMIPNNHINRPVCCCCESRCQFSSILKFYGKLICSLQCLQKKFQELHDDIS